MSLAFSSLIAFIIALGALVTVHEFGHFSVARRMGVKVLRFSIGFGKPLLRWQGKDGTTEYVIAAIPLGGYVKMLDEREGEVDPAERHLAFNNQPLWSRIAIVSAGPFANIMMAVVIYALVFSLGITGLKPVVGDISPDSAAGMAGFEQQDLIVAVEDRDVHTWQETRIQILDALMSHDDFVVRVLTSEGLERNRTVKPASEDILKREGDVLENIGLSAWRQDASPVVVDVEKGSAAQKAGLQSGDIIISTNGQPVKSLNTWIDLVKDSASSLLVLEVERNGERISIMVTPTEIEENGEKIGRVGAMVSSSALNQDMLVQVQYSLPVSILKAAEKTYHMSVLTLKMIGELITGRASARNISGPITIAEYAGRSASIGFQYYLDFIAFISVSLAVLNILPIPLLDGGHLLYYLVELVKGSPVSESVEAIGQRIGIVLLACLMTLALFNDLTRLLS